MSKKEKIFVYKPIGLDLFDPKTKAKGGQLVIKAEVENAPKNGTMGHCFIADAKSKEFLGLVWLKSLVPFEGVLNEG